MSETTARRRGHGEDAIYFAAAKNRYVGAISLGYGPDGARIRSKVFGKTKQEVRDRLKALHQELNSGVRSSSSYTVRQVVEDWLHEGLDGTSERTGRFRPGAGLRAGELWQDHGLFFASTVGTPLTANNVSARSARSPRRQASARTGHPGR